MKSFEDWNSEEMELTFGLNRCYQHPLLDQWLAAPKQHNPEQEKQLRTLQKRLFVQADYWNEDELKFFFISPLIDMIDYTGKNYKTFTQRNLTAKIKNIDNEEVELKGRVELLVATGKQDPRQPFFFIHEYKPEKRRDNDPLGQLLSAMFAARYLNATKFPLYGCYVSGRNWFFVVLEGENYCVSDAYVATREDIFDIFAILQRAKVNVEIVASSLVRGKGE